MLWTHGDAPPALQRAFRGAVLGRLAAQQQAGLAARRCALDPCRPFAVAHDARHDAPLDCRATLASLLRASST